MKIHFSVQKFDLTPELEKYASVKVIRLVRRLPRRPRSTADCHIHFSQRQKKDVKFNTCSLTLKLADAELQATETTQHMYAALDIAVVHIEQQIRDYETRRESRFKNELKRRIQAEWRPPEA